jgi:hypothetical protein
MHRSLGHDVEPTNVLTFTNDTVKKTGLSKTTINEDILIAKKLDKNERDLFKDKDISKRDALKFVQLKKKDPEKAKEVINKIESGEIKKGESNYPSLNSRFRHRQISFVGYYELLSLYRGDWKEQAGQSVIQYPCVLFLSPLIVL